MADSVGTAYLSLVPRIDDGFDASSIKDSLTSSMDGAGVGGGFASEFMGKAEGVITELAPKLAAPIAAATAGIALGKMAFDVGSSFDTMYDSIAVGTGATGDALADLNAQAREAMSNTSASADQVGATLADLNTRTGATGDTLQGLTEQFLNLDQMGMSLDVNSVTGTFNAWGISADDMGGALDDLFLVSQSTGIGMDKLASSLGTNASSLKTLGFSFEQSASMAGLFDKAGLDANGMMSKLSKAATTLAKDGQEPAEAFQESMEKMQGFVDAGDRAAAMDIASELFGTKGASQFVQALETGSMDIDELTKSVQASTGDISANADATASWDQSMARLQNNLSLMLEPLGSAVFTGASVVLETIADAAGSAYDGMCALYDEIMANEDVQSILESIGSAVGTIGGIAQSAFGSLKSAIQPIMPVVQTLGGYIGGAFGTALKTVANVCKAAADGLKMLEKAFKGDFKLPAIKLPHFKVNGGELPWGIGGKGKAPSIDVNWYATGGYGFDTPTLVGVGDANEPEHVLRDSDLTKIARRMGAAGGNNITINLNYSSDADANKMVADIAAGLRRVAMTGA